MTSHTGYRWFASLLHYQILMKTLMFKTYNTFQKSCCLDSIFVTVPCLHKSFVVLFFYIIFILDMLEMYAKLRVIDLCRLYCYHIHNTQITHLNDYCSICYPVSWICIIETPSKCTCFFFYEWLNNWSNHLMSFGLMLLLFLIFIFMRTPLTVGTLPDDGFLPP